MSAASAQRSLTAVMLVLAIAACSTAPPQATPMEDPAKRADVHVQLAASYLQRDQIETAREELQKALVIKPDHTRANYVMAVLQSRLGKKELAEQYYRRALQADAENSEAAHDYGVFLCQNNQVEPALERFNQALSNPLYRGRVLSALRAGECLMTIGDDPARAEPYFQAALEINPNLAPALYSMAGIKYTQSNYLSARGYIERYFAVGKDTAASLLLAYRIENQLGAHDIARDYARRLKKDFTLSPEAKQLGTLR